MQSRHSSLLQGRSPTAPQGTMILVLYSSPDRSALGSRRAGEGGFASQVGRGAFGAPSCSVIVVSDSKGDTRCRTNANCRWKRYCPWNRTRTEVSY